MANIDPRLTRAIDMAKSYTAGSPSRRVQAVVTLRSDDPSKPLDPNETEKSVKKLVDEAVKKTKANLNDLVVFRNLQSFSIDGDASLISKILDEDRVDSASLNAAPKAD
jgi:hypothetical protein